jgi:hypothetical protein
MTIHVDKACVMVFNTTSNVLLGLGTAWSTGGTYIKVSQPGLGIHFHHFSTGAYIWPPEQANGDDFSVLAQEA